MFHIPPEGLGVAFVESNDSVTLSNEEKLQDFYKSLIFSKIKFVVQDRKTPDGEPTSVDSLT